jgi:hypothetical protein
MTYPPLHTGRAFLVTIRPRLPEAAFWATRKLTTESQGGPVIREVLPNSPGSVVTCSHDSDRTSLKVRIMKCCENYVHLSEITINLRLIDFARQPEIRASVPRSWSKERPPAR